ncbi:Gentisate 1,2-dioxygenase [Sinosporangium album]|uniref:Gentisate 1,2-dioxygenase n=1 Tax=Sinosporangium album TaxID=504805 RepID=A0A1G7ZUI2_9ACTN|nr:cupin domain-containing protein [Sinosporangium album]SDH12226.1 Gentisate 1,2-dioxygenase [Sinosporangium album]
MDDRFLVNSYLEWSAAEGVPVHEGFGFNLLTTDLGPWARFGDTISGALIHLEGRGDWLNAFVIEIPAGGNTDMQRHMYEEIIYVLSGHGSTEIETADGVRHSFEWGESGLFAIPMNAKYRHFNLDGSRPARLAAVTDLPVMINLIHDERFIFENDFDFDRVRGEKSYNGDGELVERRPGRHQWTTNYAPSLRTLQLKEWAQRGVGSSNIHLVLADGTVHAHVSEMPPGSYKNGHRHGPDFHIFPVSGEGYSLFWYEGDKDFNRMDWAHGSLYAPADQMFHQHFNVSPGPSRYLAFAFGSIRYPVTQARADHFSEVDMSVKEGGLQISKEHEDPRVLEIFAKELAQRGIPLAPEFEARWALRNKSV